MPTFFGTLPSDLRKLRVLLTAGPTQEAINPVRFLSNHSTVKMGYGLAACVTSVDSRVLVFHKL